MSGRLLPACLQMLQRSAFIVLGRGVQSGGIDGAGAKSHGWPGTRARPSGRARVDGLYWALHCCIFKHQCGMSSGGQAGIPLPCRELSGLGLPCERSTSALEQGPKP